MDDRHYLPFSRVTADPSSPAGTQGGGERLQAHRSPPWRARQPSPCLGWPLALSILVCPAGPLRRARVPRGSSVESSCYQLRTEHVR